MFDFIIEHYKNKIKQLESELDWVKKRNGLLESENIRLYKMLNISLKQEIEDDRKRCKEFEAKEE